MTKNLITFDEKNKVFHLHNDQISYLISIEDGGTLSHLYFGKSIKAYHGELRYPRLDRGFSGNLPGSLDRTFSKDSFWIFLDSNSSFTSFIGWKILHSKKQIKVNINIKTR